MTEKGRYHSPKIPGEKRFCQICKNKVEDEKHFIIKCKLYDVERKNLELWFNNFLNIDFSWTKHGTKTTVIVYQRQPRNPHLHIGFCVCVR